MVLLVDEYDKPLLGHLGKPDVVEIRDALKEFYSVIKTCEGLQRVAVRRLFAFGCLRPVVAFDPDAVRAPCGRRERHA